MVKLYLFWFLSCNWTFFSDLVLKKCKKFKITLRLLLLFFLVFYQIWTQILSSKRLINKDFAIFLNFFLGHLHKRERERERERLL